jgi:hypothetical protein
MHTSIYVEGVPIHVHVPVYKLRQKPTCTTPSYFRGHSNNTLPSVEITHFYSE